MIARAAGAPRITGSQREKGGTLALQTPPPSPGAAEYTRGPVPQLRYPTREGTDETLLLTPEMKPVTIGRVGKVTIQLNYPSVSRKHCTISWSGGRFILKDLGSANGTRLNGDAVTADIGLHDGDHIICGDVSVHFEALAAPAATPKKPTPPPARETTGTSDQLSTDLARAQSALKKAEAAKEELGDTASAFEKRILELESDRDRIRGERDEMRTKLEDASGSSKEAENKNMKMEVQLDSVTEKYRQVLGDQDGIKAEIVRLKEELVEKSEIAEELEDKASALSDEVERIQSGSADTDKQIRDFKIRVTERDRQINQLQDQVAELEYDVNESQKENTQLQSEYNRDEDEVQRMERRINQLRDVIKDKENVIAELRSDTEAKEREVVQLRMGAGVQDIEEERRGVMEDFYRKSRELDKMKDDLQSAQRLSGDAEGQLQDLRDKLETAEEQLTEKNQNFREAEKEGRDMKRQISSLEGEKEGLSEQLQDLESKMSDVSPEKLKNAEKALSTAEAKLEKQQQKLEEARTMSQSATENAGSHAASRKSAAAECETVEEAFLSLKGNLSMLSTYAKDTESAVDALGEGSESIVEALKPLVSTLSTVDSEARDLKKGIARIRTQLEE